MAIRTKAEIIKGIKKSSRYAGGKYYETWEIYFGMGETGKKIRTVKPTKDKAIKHVEDYFKALDTNGCMMTALKPKDVLDAREARDMLIAAGLGDVTLRQCAREFIGREYRRVRSIGSLDITVGTAYAEYLKSIPVEGETQRKCVVQRVGKWADEFGHKRLLLGVTSKDVAEYVSRQGKSVKTRNNARGYIKSFLEWCCAGERRYLSVNPCASMKLEPEPYKEPLFISAADMEKLAVEVQANHSASLPYLVLSYWCGIRTAEIERLSESPEDIKWEEKTVRISKVKGWTSGHKPRVVHIEDNAIAWMKMIGIREAITRRSILSMRNSVYEAAKNAGVKLGHNMGRHSYITHLSAKTGDTRLAEGMAGTSSAMRTKSYDGLATKTEGEAYFAITPA